MAADGADGAEEARQAAKAAGLRYVHDTMPGIGRSGTAPGFRYLGTDGQPLDDPKEIARIEALVIPPAWTDVWIAPTSRAHIQVTGRDAKGRKQYRYHPKWRAHRDETKYGRMVAFGEALPTIRTRVDELLAMRGLPREKVLGTVVALLDMTHIRIGNEEYARDNKTFGLTTMREDHVAVSGATIRFQFRGKAGKEHQVDVRDRRLARIISRCQELPGQELFHYLDDEEQPHPIGSDDVNEFLHELTGQGFTAKDFRTWAGTVVASCALSEAGAAASDAQGKREVVQAIKAAAAHLGNTPAICRKSYVHPAVIAAYLDGSLFVPREAHPAAAIPPQPLGLRPEEEAVLDFLRDLALVAA